MRHSRDRKYRPESATALDIGSGEWDQETHTIQVLDKPILVWEVRNGVAPPLTITHRLRLPPVEVTGYSS